jgi:hypothetical protein
MQVKYYFEGRARYSLILIPLFLWIWLCRDWPVRLGFFCDDWMVLLHPFVGTAAAFKDVANMVATRPASAPFTWLAQVAADWSPVRSQIFNAAMLLLTATSVGILSAALLSTLDKLRKGAVAGACFATAAFIVFPSTIGTFAWGIGVTAVVPTTPLFCLGASCLLYSEDSRWRLGVGLLLVLLSHLSYEAFYFQEIALVLIATTLRGGRLGDIPWRTVTGAVIVNVLCIAFNRLTTGGIQKTFNPDFLHAFGGGYSHILAILGHAVREHKSLVAGSALVASLSGAVCLSGIVGILRVSFALLLTTCGVAAAGLLYAAAGYGFAAEGTMARVSIVLATYYGVATGVLTAAAYYTMSRHRLMAAIFFLSALTSFAFLELTARARVADWADAWSYELARLSRLPETLTTHLGKTDPQRIYVAIEKKQPSPVEPAMAPWEINGAIAWAVYRATNNRLLTLDIWRGQRTSPYWFATSPNWLNHWDGKNFEQGFCGSRVVIYHAPGTELWSWDTSTGALAKMDAPWEFGCS